MRNLSDKTIQEYEMHYNIFVTYIDSAMHISSITLDTIQNWILYLKEKNTCNDITINSYLRTIRVFFYWCMNNDYMQDEFRIPSIKTDKKIKETYTDYELSLLLKRPNIKQCSFTDYKTWVLTNFF